MNTCLDEGLLQAYLDGELAPAQMEAAAAHLAACAVCAELAHEAEHEYALFSTAFAPVLATPPPTERLRARLEDAIAELQAPPRHPHESPAERLRSWWAAVAPAFVLTPRRAAAFASFLLAVALTVTLTMMRPQPSGPEQIAHGVRPEQVRVDGSTAGVSSAPTTQDIKRTNNNGIDGVRAGGSNPVEVTKAKYARRVVSPTLKSAAAKEPVPPVAALLPDERNYLTTIATLDAAIKAQGQQALTPTLRAEYERNLAVVDQAIIATRVAARRNPRDADAKEFLRAAYQNKVELLTTVSDQTQYIAARD